MIDPLPSRSRDADSRHRRCARSGWVLWCLCLALTACQSWHPEPLDLAEPGWVPVRGLAVWHPGGEASEWTGEFLLATDPPHRGYVQFGKGPMTLAEARVEGDRWMARGAGSRRSQTGTGTPPEGLVWHGVLRAALGLPLPPEWHWSGSADGDWHLEHAISGERVSGTRLP